MPVSTPDPGPRRRPVLTGRALVLGALVVLLVVVLASPVQRYLASRNAVSSAAQQLRHDRSQLRSLRAQQQMYGDPGYISEQARSRLQYAMPGDTVYVVTGVHSADRAHHSSVATTRSAWNQRLWNSLDAAAK